MIEYTDDMGNLDEIAFWDEKDPTSAGLEVRERVEEVVNEERSRWPTTTSSSLEGIRIGIPQVFYPSLSLSPSSFFHINYPLMPAPYRNIFQRLFPHITSHLFTPSSLR